MPVFENFQAGLAIVQSWISLEGFGRRQIIFELLGYKLAKLHGKKVPVMGRQWPR